MSDTSYEYAIPLRIGDLARLFNSLDPSPFRERDLDAEAEKFIVGGAREAPHDVPIAIIVQLSEQEGKADPAQVIEEALRNNFEWRVGEATRELRELFREGWRALVIGIPILAISLLASQLIGNAAGPTAPARVISESLLILGWVANWRPLSIFLYGWWPIVRRRNLYRRLAAARVAVHLVPGRPTMKFESVVTHEASVSARH